MWQNSALNNPMFVVVTTVFLVLNPVTSTGHDCGGQPCACCKSGFCININGTEQCDRCKDGFTGLKCTEDCYPNCVNCSQQLFEGERKCFHCKAGFFNGRYMDDARYPQNDECINVCQAGCDACSSYKTCSHCKLKYFLNSNNECVQCPSFCDVCSSNTTCASCHEGFFWNKRFCQPCKSDCKICNETDCNECTEGHYLSGSECKTCQTGCLTCNAFDNCSACDKGYHLGGKRCLCSDNCVKCSDNSFSEEKTCNECVDGYYLLNSICNKCSHGCSVCTSEINCSRCDDTFMLMNGQCTQCPFECKSCSSHNYCETCGDGYYSESGKCLPCPKDCRSCTSTTNCTECISGYFGDACSRECPNNCHEKKCNKFTGNCIACLDRYYLDTENQNCVKCPENCKACDTNGTCFSCENGFMGEKCRDICSNCAPESKCDKYSGYCEETCRVGFSGENCAVKCDSKCSLCDRKFPNECKTCAHNRHGKSCEEYCSKQCLNSSCNDIDGFCTGDCLTGHWGNKCENECPLNCKDNLCDRGNGSCSNGCLKSYKGSQCLCPNNCICSSLDECDSCEKGYYGELCSERCGDGCAECNKTSGACVKKCLRSKKSSICETDGSPKEEHDTTSENGLKTAPGIILGVALPASVVVGGAIAVILYRKRPVSWRKQNIVYKTVSQNENSRQDQTMTRIQLLENIRQSFRRSRARIKLKTPPTNDALDEIMPEDTPDVKPSPILDDTYYNTAALKRRRIKVRDLEQHVTNKSAKTINEEFDELPGKLLYSYEDSQKRENYNKNRYRGVYPYDKNRVILKDSDNDYINASYIDVNKRHFDYFS